MKKPRNSKKKPTSNKRKTKVSSRRKCGGAAAKIPVLKDLLDLLRNRNNPDFIELFNSNHGPNQAQDCLRDVDMSFSNPALQTRLENMFGEGSFEQIRNVHGENVNQLQEQLSMALAKLQSQEQRVNQPALVYPSESYLGLMQQPAPPPPAAAPATVHSTISGYHGQSLFPAQQPVGQAVVQPTQQQVTGYLTGVPSLFPAQQPGYNRGFGPVHLAMGRAGQQLNASGWPVDPWEKAEARGNLPK